MVEQQEERCFGNVLLEYFGFIYILSQRRTQEEQPFGLTCHNVVNVVDKAENPFKSDDGKWKISFISIILQILHTSDAASLNIRVRRQLKSDVIH